jgi:hypothetical protein
VQPGLAGGDSAGTAARKRTHQAAGRTAAALRARRRREAGAGTGRNRTGSSRSSEPEASGRRASGRLLRTRCSVGSPTVSGCIRASGSMRITPRRSATVKVGTDTGFVPPVPAVPLATPTLPTWRMWRRMSRRSRSARLPNRPRWRCRLGRDCLVLTSRESSPRAARSVSLPSVSRRTSWQFRALRVGQ